jgi:hypothetical protein
VPRWSLFFALTTSGCFLAYGFDDFLASEPDSLVDATDGGGVRGGLALRFEPDVLELLPGEKREIDVIVDRRDGFTSAVALGARTEDKVDTDLSSVSVSEGATRARVTVSARPDATPTDSASLLVTGSSGTLRAEGRLPIVIRGRPGTLDDTFGNGGVAVVDLGASFRLRELVRRIDGDELLVSGILTTDPRALFVARLTRGGTLDPSFAAGGIARVSLPGGVAGEGGGALAQGADGRVSVAAPGPPLTLAQLARDGSREPTFGAGGVALVADGLEVTTLLQRPRGELVLAGSRGSRAAILQLLPGGAVDPSFGVDGSAGYGGSPVESSIKGAALASDGTVVGAIDFGSSQYRSFSGFGVDPRGMPLPPNALPPANPPFYTVNHVLRAGTGEIVAVGAVDSTSVGELRPRDASSDALTEGIVAYRSADGGLAPGRPDVVRVAALPLRGGAFDGEGRLVVSGSGVGTGLVLARLLHDGGVDPTFAGAPPSPAGLFAERVAIERSGRIVVAFASRDATSTSLVLVRFWP